ncbi:HsdM family class I SAM-dependent methyltransferase [Bifidobacterium scaligerum]|uniref:site-specific DNA-methyltransferase (adenine-specific) n=1 Tax=Bifidobacterium scaligerum TaxID=2052656 RepID=A0A2M9HTJ2_9BIFI|nr:N-6 DNA methylase [Bifidobacterium scaligerum]PJM80117.1 hypothetical protein CUU80_03090 [Bifidobacterium scaligerum]
MEHDKPAKWSFTENTLSSADIARMAGVRPSAVSNWRNRENKNFPKPVDSKDGRPLFDYDEVAAWLTSNNIAFEDTRMEQAAWSFFDRWRNQADPMAMMSLLLWSLCARSAANSLHCEVEWQAFLSKVDAEQSYTDACQQLVNVLLNAYDGNSTAAARLALTPPSEIEQLQPDELAELLHFANNLFALGTDKMNQLVSIVLERTIISQGRMSGEFGCPKSRVSVLLAKLAAAHINKHESGKQSIIAYDPACGILESLLQLGSIIDKDINTQQPAVGDNQQSNSERTIKFHCADINVRTSTIAARRFLLADLTGVSLDIHTQDCLVQDSSPYTRADVVVLETPFALRWEPNDTDLRWRYGMPTKNDSALAWVQDALAHLSDVGRAFVVTSGGPLFRAGSETDVRRALVAAGCVEAIIALPSNLYVNTSIPTFLWVLTPPNKTRDTVSMVSMTVESDAYGVQDKPIEWMEQTLKWFAHGSLLPTRPLIAQTVRSIELLGDPQVNLLPSQWLDADKQTPDEIELTYTQQQDALTPMNVLASKAFETLQQFDAQGLDCRGITTVRLGSIATIRQGDYKPERKSGYALHEQVTPEDVVTPDDVSAHQLRELDSTQESKEGNRITVKNDILLISGELAKAVVDESGGRRVHKNVHIVRLMDEQRWNPQYVAIMAEGTWSRDRQTPSIFVKGIRPAQLQIPALPLDQQNRVVAYAHAVETLRQSVELYRTQLDTVTSAIRHGAAIGMNARKQSKSDQEQ